MDAVGDVADGNLVLRHARIKRLPHVAADLAVQFAHGVGRARQFQRQHRHAKRLVGVLRIHPAQPQNVRPRHGQGGAVAVQRVIHHGRRESVVPSLHRRVRGEDAMRLRLGQRVGIFPAARHFLAHQFQREKRRVALVHVKHRGLDAERAQQPHAADAQQNFLHDARRAVAAIDPRGEIAEMLVVFRQIGVEQIDRHAPDVDAPGLERHVFHVDLDAAHEPFALGVQHRFQRHVLRIDQIVKLRLPVVRVNRLLEIALAVKQADADKAEAKVARGFGVVARQDAEAARRNRQRLVETELGGKIGDRILVQLRRVLVPPRVLLVEIRLEIVQHGAGVRLEARLLQMHAQFVIRHLAQNGDGVVKQVLPAARRQFLEQILRLLVPRPPQIVRELVQARDQFVQFRARQRFSCHRSFGNNFPAPMKLRNARCFAIKFLCPICRQTLLLAS